MFLGQAGPDFAKADHALREHIEATNKQLPEDQQQFIGSRDYNYLRNWWGHWLQNGTVVDAPRAGRRHRCSEDDAKEAAQICKEGKLIAEKVKGKTVMHRVHFTSLAEAIRETLRLQQIMTDNNLESPEQLLHAMHTADPSLVRRKLFFKHNFTVQELEERVAYAWNCMQAQQSWPDFLNHTIYIDESSFVVDKYTESDVWVWCDKHDLNFSDVVPRKLKQGNKSLTVKFIVAVTSHPAFKDKGGVVYMEFTTGTTKIRRQINVRVDGAGVERDMEYEVSLLHQGDPVVAVTVNVTAAVGNQHLQQLYIGQLPVAPVHHSCSACWCQHNGAACCRIL
jgi:hypothetical protein